LEKKNSCDLFNATTDQYILRKAQGLLNGMPSVLCALRTFI